MELRHLRYFVAVAEGENVSRAALRLHVSQPALSQQIRDLENELGFLLLERTAKSVRLTEAGRTFHSEARALLLRAENAVKSARAVAVGERGNLHIGYSATPTVRFLSTALRAFHAITPAVRVKLHDLSTEEMIAGVRNGALQIAFQFRPQRDLLRGLRFEEVMKEPLCFAVPRRHAFARLRSVRLEEVAREPLVAFSKREYPEYHDMLVDVFATIKSRPHIVEEHEDAANLVTAIDSGFGFAVIAQSIEMASERSLKLIPLRPALSLRLGAICPASEMTAAAERFLQCARAESKRSSRHLDDTTLSWPWHPRSRAHRR
ncbi:LysR substrate-binding domain-containing protein [Opitutus sp. GAS368]|uniref:LysR family transcriptional regulator n=1 Tax=Opitutus sp. GAS368 TaxID=1882749 RepID=UPI0008797890|nr:LysR substrate-binding domain-containing protein [Opitutus sp. GAS368]SDS05255.1 transcriptional regulator, LysR family [Opitutus sp. GAS368]